MTDQLTPPEQNDLLGEATKLLVDQLPAGWHRLILDYMALGKKVNVGAAVRMADGTTPRVSAPRELAPLFSRLRGGMYVAGRGTWYSFRLIVDPPARYSVQYNWNDQPPYPTPPAPEHFRLEQERFPRAEDAMPEWFRRGLTG
ncbi:hypothetical protein [Actinophytocola gossypii]|uniref:Uncharacterized protein n=1 Tax=Actinophytocola gossypii TaxID=2812003 RepID=A0ABT2JA64_9PSEU|nr:hypothetical protein [Actinophytocola gossypii]MCT2584350.1 hypothetical protein [Actinophytocola gossypii]